jgi:hypothetical protein
VEWVKEFAAFYRARQDLRTTLRQTVEKVVREMQQELGANSVKIKPTGDFETITVILGPYLIQLKVDEAVTSLIKMAGSVEKVDENYILMYIRGVLSDAIGCPEL